jgi:hypothetical protein
MTQFSSSAFSRARAGKVSTAEEPFFATLATPVSLPEYSPAQLAYPTPDHGMFKLRRPANGLVCRVGPGRGSGCYRAAPGMSCVSV